MRAVLSFLLVLKLVLYPVHGMALAGFKFPQYIISAEQALALMADTENWVLIDVRSREDYEEGHIEKALNLPLKQLTREQRLANGKVVKGLMITAEDFTPVIQALGVSADTTVLVYSNAGDPRASQFWWIMHHYGHTKTQVIDGGMQAMESHAANISFIRHEPRKKGNFQPRVKDDVVVDFGYVLGRLNQPQVILIDGVSPQQYRKAHLANAKNIYYKSTFKNNGYLKPAADLKQALIEAGLSETSNKEVIFYCGGGWYSAHNYLIAHSLGFANLKIYDGSRKDWIARNGPMVSE